MNLDVRELNLETLCRLHYATKREMEKRCNKEDSPPPVSSDKALIPEWVSRAKHLEELETRRPRDTEEEPKPTPAPKPNKLKAVKRTKKVKDAPQDPFKELCFKFIGNHGLGAMVELCQHFGCTRVASIPLDQRDEAIKMMEDKS